MTVTSCRNPKINDTIKNLKKAVDDLDPVLNKFRFDANFESEYSYEYKKAYKILGIGETSTVEQVKISFRALVLKHHPDKSCRMKDNSKLKEIIQAYKEINKKQMEKTWMTGDCRP
jgi:preprotein translocase subunit Sec63